LKVAQELGETSLMFLVRPTLTDADMESACQIIGDVLSMPGEKKAGSAKLILELVSIIAC
jgi:hypothetical protein